MENNIIKRTVEANLIISSVDITNISGRTTLCVADNIFLDGTPPGGTWKSMNPSVATVNLNGEVTGISAGIAEIRYIYNSIGCIDSASIMIKVTLPTVEAATTPEICGRENGTITLTVNNSEEPSTIKYKWDNFPNTTSILSNIKAGTYKATISDTFCIIEKTISVEHTDGPIANFEANTYHVIKTQKFTLTDMSQGTVQTWHWDMGDGNTQASEMVSYTYPDTGIYTVFLEIADINNCTDTISKNIYVHDSLKIFVPNMFTPNGDGLNDTWKPVMLDYSIEGYQLSVFDRWGQRIFHTADTEEAWDGTINGEPVAPNTVYSYQVIIRDIAKKEHKFAGSVTVVK
jgi:gliding motility-associated-like protein